MNPDNFEKSSPGKLVKRTAEKGDYWSFVPHNLPPRVEIDPEILGLLSNANIALGRLAGVDPRDQNPMWLSLLIRREAVRSTRIEGTVTTISEVVAFEARQNANEISGNADTAAKSQDIGEVLNYIDALRYGQSKVTDDLPISNRLIRELHGRLMKGVRGSDKTPGEFRRRQNAIGSSDDDIYNAPYVPPPIDEMAEALNALESYIHSGSEPDLLKLAFIHYQFEAIHPFLDGNGRIGRLLIPILLVQWGVMPAPLLFLSIYFDKNRDRYYDLLMSVSTKGDWKSWLMFFLTAVITQSEDTIKKSSMLRELREQWHDQLDQPRTSARLLQVVDDLFLFPAITVPEIQRKFGYSHRGADQIVKRLVGEGLLKELPSSRRTRVFLAPKILELLEE